MRSRIIPMLCAVALSAGAALVQASRELAPRAENLVTRAAPRAVPLADLKIREAGLAASPYFSKADEIRVFASEARMNASPAARIWVHAGQTNLYWFQTGGSGSAETYVIPQGAAVVVLTRASTNALPWTNPLEAP